MIPKPQRRHGLRIAFGAGQTGREITPMVRDQSIPGVGAASVLRD